MRHDWYWPPVASLWSGLAEILGGWHPQGFGSVYAYPADYLANIIFVTLRYLIGVDAAFVIFTLLVATVVTTGALRLSRALGLDSPGRANLIIFALFNPFVYAKIVAGHGLMIIAYGGLLHLSSTSMRRQLDARAAQLALLAVLQQLQFFVIAVAALLLRRRPSVETLLFCFIISLPLALGLVFDFGIVAQTPYNVMWERSQSVDWSKALILCGYFTSYCAAFEAAPMSYVLYGVPVLSIVGIWYGARENRRVFGVAFSAALVILMVTGVRGPLAGILDWLIVRVPESGLFRELYDLLAITAICYAFLMGLALRALRVLNVPLALINIAILVVWLAHPPPAWWVPRDAVPQMNVSAMRDTRFALLPPFQPLSYRGRGAGIDPDWYVHAQNITPLNDVLPRYPEDAALSLYSQTRDQKVLEALSVSEVVDRPWFKQNVEALNLQSAVPFQRLSVSPGPAVRRLPHPIPETSIIAKPQITSLPTKPGDGNIFFADTGTQAIAPVPFSHTDIDAKLAWVDARLAFRARPNLAQPFGGALTTSNVSLSVRAGMQILAYIDGRILRDDGTPIHGSTHGYEWVSVPRDTQRIKCAGLCVIALQGRVPPIAVRGHPQPFAAASLEQWTPWFARVHAGSNASGYLRYNVRWDSGWSAFCAGRRLDHVKFDGIANGWKLDGCGTLTLVHIPSLLQLAAELLALTFIGRLIFRPKQRAQ